METILAQGAEATIVVKDDLLYKKRLAKSYRHHILDDQLRKSRTRRELKGMAKARELGVLVPLTYEQPDEYTLVMDYIKGNRLRDEVTSNSVQIQSYFTQTGKYLATLHEAGLIHGDLTTSNILVAKHNIYFIDFGLSFISKKIEDMAVDIHVFEEALESTHYEHASTFFTAFLTGYKQHPQYKEVLERLEIVRARGRNKK